MPAGRPNVIVVLTDQLRPFELGCHGHPVVRTPNIDALAAGGVRFATAVSNNPVCTPGRSCLLSGQYSRTCAGRVSNETDESPGRSRPRFPDPTIADRFRAAGYRTALIGKWHVGSHPSLMGFDTVDYPAFNHFNWRQVYFDDTGRAYRCPGYAEDHNQELLGRLLDAAAGEDRPFFVYYNIATPHMPFFDVPPEYQTIYAAADVVLRPNVELDGELPGNAESFIGGGRWFDIYMWGNLTYTQKTGLHVPDDFTIRDLYARYYGMVSFTDHHLGRLMDQLRERGLADDTLVVFTSDHGDILGSHHRYNKDTLDEEATRIPLIFHRPSTWAPRVVDAQVGSLIDVMPSVLAAAGVAIPEAVQGQDLGPVLDGSRAALDRSHAFIETAFAEIGVRTPTELYGLRYAEGGHHEVDGVRFTKPLSGYASDDAQHYDLVTDPYQLENLAEDPGDDDHGLRAMLEEWDAATPWLTGPVTR